METDVATCYSWCIMKSAGDPRVMQKLGERFRDAREKAGMTQAEVATAAGLNANYYSRVERGEINLAFDRLRRIMKALKIKSLDVTD